MSRAGQITHGSAVQGFTLCDRAIAGSMEFASSLLTMTCARCRGIAARRESERCSWERGGRPEEADEPEPISPECECDGRAPSVDRETGYVDSCDACDGARS